MKKRDDEILIEIQEHIRLLNALFQKPQLGLTTWAKMVGEHMDWLVKWWTEGIE